MSINNFIDKFSKDENLFNEIYKNIITNQKELDKLGQLNILIDPPDIEGFKTKDIFDYFIKKKVMAQHFLNVYRNNEYFIDSSENVIFKDSKIINTFKRLSIEDRAKNVTQLCLEYAVLFQMLLSKEEEKSDEEEEIYMKKISKSLTEKTGNNLNMTLPSMKVQKENTQKHGFCTYCDTKLTEDDTRCSVCEAEVKNGYNVIVEPLKKIPNKNEGIIKNCKRKDSLASVESLGNDENNLVLDNKIVSKVNENKTIFKDEGTMNPKKLLIQSKYPLNDNREKIYKENEVQLILPEDCWTCSYCTQENKEGSVKCETCLAEKIKDTKNDKQGLTIKNEDNINKKNNYKNEFNPNIKNTQGQHSHEKYEERIVKSVTIKNEYDVAVPSKLNKSLDYQLQNKGKKVSKEECCDWQCRRCGFKNIDISVKCETCLACLEEGKPNSKQNIEKEKKEKEIISQENKIKIENSNFNTKSMEKEIFVENKMNESVLSEQTNKNIKVETSQNHILIVSLKNKNNEVSVKSDSDCDSLHVPIKEKVAESSESKNTRTKVEQKTSKNINNHNIDENAINNKQHNEDSQILNIKKNKELERNLKEGQSSHHKINSENFTENKHNLTLTSNKKNNYKNEFNPNIKNTQGQQSHEKYEERNVKAVTIKNEYAVAVPSKLNKSLDYQLQNKGKKVPKEEYCDWKCRRCGFKNIDISVKCETCLACLEEGKPNSKQNIEKERRGKENISQENKIKIENSNFNTKPMEKEISVENKINENVLSKQTKENIKVETSQNHSLIVPLKNRNNEVSLKSDSDCDSSHVPIKEKVAESSESKNTRTKVEQKTSKNNENIINNKQHNEDRQILNIKKNKELERNVKESQNSHHKINNENFTENKHNLTLTPQNNAQMSTPPSCYSKIPSAGQPKQTERFNMPCSPSYGVDHQNNNSVQTQSDISKKKKKKSFLSCLSSEDKQGSAKDKCSHCNTKSAKSKYGNLCKKCHSKSVKHNNSK